MLYDLPKTCIVVPCFNEADRFPLDGFRDFISPRRGMQIIFADDGSTDNTPNILAEIQREFPEQISLIRHERNCGKAAAVRSGILSAVKDPTVEIAGFWDADLSTPLDAIDLFRETFRERSKLAMLCGSRIKRMGAQIERKTLRHYFGRAFATLAGVITNLPVYDTQCGAKMFRKDVAEKLFCEPFISRWCFDVEIFCRFVSMLGRDNALASIVEIPLERWKDISGSKFQTFQIPSVATDLWKIFWKYRRGTR